MSADSSRAFLSAAYRPIGTRDAASILYGSLGFNPEHSEEAKAENAYSEFDPLRDDDPVQVGDVVRRMGDKATIGDVVAVYRNTVEIAWRNAVTEIPPDRYIILARRLPPESSPDSGAE